MSAELIARLIEAGTPAQLVADVAMALGAAVADQTALRARRQQDAARQQDKRDRVRASRDVTARTVTSTDTVDETPAPSPPSPFSPQTPLKPQPPHPHPRDVAPPRKGTVFAEPVGVTVEQWVGFTGQRKKKLTDRAYALLCRKLAHIAARSGWPPGDLIDLATERGWETIYEPKEHRRDGQRPHQDRQPSSGPVNPLVRAGIAREARFAAAAGEVGDIRGRADAFTQ